MSRTERYHLATRYSPETVAAHPGLDWSRKPPTEKTFHSRERVLLGPHLLLARPDGDADALPIMRPPEDGASEIERLSTLLLHAYGVTALMTTPGGDVFFRAAPSAGALYPNEVYVVSHGVDGLAAGIWNYQVADHALAPVLEGDFRGDLDALGFRHPALAEASLVLLISAVFERSSWRYGDRGYRRVLLDSGHLLGNVVLFAPEVGLHATPIGGFDDRGLGQMLMLGEDEEAPLVLLPLTERPHPAQAVASPPAAAAAVEPASDGDALALHRAGRAAAPAPPREARRPAAPLPKPAGPCRPATGAPIDWGRGIGHAILSRRSARHLDPAAITLAELGSVLDWSWAPIRADESAVRGRAAGFFDVTRLETLLAVRAVDGLRAGLYLYDPLARSLCLWRAGDFSRVCCHIALGQELALNAAAVIFHTADLGALADAWGDRGYRLLGMDAGHLGQRVNLAAIALGLGVCGIGGYFDDEIGELFALGGEQAPIYATCLGRLPAADAP